MRPVKDALLESDFKEEPKLFFDVDPANVL